ncbi:hypothetical protein LCGC14_2961290 [marine sediment metagenome]|uniref:Uncharacterized protein n=1 Tax=marine sediment metagenome TaxID=412755 RepID=A0A0F9A3F9_9ZZZZ
MHGGSTEQSGAFERMLASVASEPNAFDASMPGMAWRRLAIDTAVEMYAEGDGVPDGVSLRVWIDVLLAEENLVGLTRPERAALGIVPVPKPEFTPEDIKREAAFTEARHARQAESVKDKN